MGKFRATGKPHFKRGQSSQSKNGKTLDAQYGTRFGVPVTPAMLDILTMWPCIRMINIVLPRSVQTSINCTDILQEWRYLTMFSVSIRGRNSKMHQNWENTFTANTWWFLKTLEHISKIITSSFPILPPSQSPSQNGPGEVCRAWCRHCWTVMSPGGKYFL